MQNVLQYLEQTAISFPKQTAVSYRDTKLTFEELNILSQKIGKTIQQYSLTNQAIGVFGNRGIETVSFFLGVLYSGNFYVPLDPDMPAMKLQHILQDANISVVLGNSDNLGKLQDVEYQGTFLTLCDIGEETCSIPNIEEETPAYMVYTSGSTGKPKGVLKGHKAIISYIEAYVETFDFSAKDIIGNQTPFFFDASAKDIYLMLKTGATMEILPSELFSMPTMLIEYLNEKRITFISWVPTALALVSQCKVFSFVLPTTLQKVFFVGEVMPMKHLNYWRNALPNVLFVNLYGQSELAGICCYYPVSGTFENTEVLPMGQVLPNCKIYLIADGKMVTEAEQIGEIYLVSDALAIEYYHDAEKTKSNFLQMDFGEGLVRCFKSGDLAKKDEQGNFVFASRNDYQIKHMGHRIELGEIEAICGGISEIQRCCCLYDSVKSKIILFCELCDGVEKTGQEVQSSLRSMLSTYMLPSKVHILKRLPLNANGKIDRQALKELL